MLDLLFDVSDVDQEMWRERQLRRALTQKARAFSQGFQCAIESLDQPTTPVFTVDAVAELRDLAR